MKLVLDIVQSLLLPKLKKDASFDDNKSYVAFLETITNAFLEFEKDAKPVYAAIYSLGLKDPEKIISKLDTVYISLIKELAENHVLGIGSEAIDYLISSKNSSFEKEVQFFTDLQNAIKKVERKHIKMELPRAFDKLNFQLSDDAIALAIKKKEREVLKEKMKSWDDQLVTSEVTTFYNVSAKKESNVISLSWIKYAAAACIYFSVGIQFYKYNNFSNLLETGDYNFVTAPAKKETITPKISSVSLAEVFTVAKTAPVIESGLGFASKEKKIKIIENDQRARMQSIVIAIDKYRQFLEKELIENKVGYGPVIKEIESKIKALQNELALLKERDNHYIFDGKELVIYNSSTARENSVVLYDKKYYLKRDSDYYLLNITMKNEKLIKEINTDIIEILNELTIENQ